MAQSAVAEGRAPECGGDGSLSTGGSLATRSSDAVCGQGVSPSAGNYVASANVLASESDFDAKGAADTGSKGPVTLHLVTGDHYPPYVDGSLPDDGWVTKVIVESLKNAGFQVAPLEWLPWKRGLEETRAGRTDGTFPWGYTDERARQMLYSDPIFWNTAYAWVTAQSDIDGQKLDGLHFCLPLGYVEFGRTRELVERNPSARVSVRNMTQCFRMLNAKRVDFVVSTSNDARSALADAGLEPADFKYLMPKMHEITYHFVIAKSRPHAREIIDAVNQGLKRLDQAGAIRRVN